MVVCADMATCDLIPLTGRVLEVLPAGQFKIQPVDSGHADVMAYLSGRMRQNKIRLVLGDLVIVEVSPYDPGKGRITRRK